MANCQLLILNAISNDCFLSIQLAEKKKRGLDRSKRIKARAKFSDVTFFFLWFNLNNFCFPVVGITTNLEKVDDPNTGIADVDKPDTGTADLEEANRAEVDRVDTEGAEEPGTGTADPAEADGAEVDGTKVDGMEADGTEADGMDKPDT